MAPSTVKASFSADGNGIHVRCDGQADHHLDLANGNRVRCFASGLRRAGADHPDRAMVFGRDALGPLPIAEAEPLGVGTAVPERSLYSSRAGRLRAALRASTCAVREGGLQTATPQLFIDDDPELPPLDEDEARGPNDARLTIIDPQDEEVRELMREIDEWERSR